MPVPTITPYPKDGSANANVPVGQTGYPVAQNFIGPIAPQWGQVGQPVTTTQIPNVTQGQSYNLTPQNNTPAPQQQQSSGGIRTNDDAIRAGYTGLNDYLDQINRQQGAGDNNAALNAEVDRIYNEGMGVMDEQVNQLGRNQATDEANLNTNVENQRAKANTEQEQLVTEQTQTNDQAMQTIASALEDAVRAFNALKQKGAARFGMGSSMGRNFSEIAAQEFYKNQGKVGETKANAATTFATNIGKIKTYISQKITDLDQYKNEALASLQKSYQDSLNQINNNRYQLSSQKSRDKMGLMQDTINNARQIAAQNTQFKQSILTAAINNMQTTMGRSLSADEIQQVITSTGIDTSGASNVFGKATSVPTQTLSYVPTKYKTQDELAQATNPLYSQSGGQQNNAVYPTSYGYGNA